MKRLIFAGILICICVASLVIGWILGQADHAARSNSFAAEAAIFLANDLEKKGIPIPDQLFTQIDAAVESMDAVLPLVIDPKKRKQIQNTYLKVAEFKDRHPAWIQYYNGSTWPFQKDETVVRKTDAILAEARKVETASAPPRTAGIHDRDAMQATLAAEIPMGTPIAKAKTILENEGFKCSFEKGPLFVNLNQIGNSQTDPKGGDYLDGDRSDGSPVSRRWQVRILEVGDVTGDISVTTGLVGP